MHFYFCFVSNEFVIHILCFSICILIIFQYFLASSQNNNNNIKRVICGFNSRSVVLFSFLLNLFVLLLLQPSISLYRFEFIRRAQKGCVLLLLLVQIEFICIAEAVVAVFLTVNWFINLKWKQKCAASFMFPLCIHTIELHKHFGLRMSWQF